MNHYLGKRYWHLPFVQFCCAPGVYKTLVVFKPFAKSNKSRTFNRWYCDLTFMRNRVSKFILYSAYRQLKSEYSAPQSAYRSVSSCYLNLEVFPFFSPSKVIRYVNASSWYSRLMFKVPWVVKDPFSRQHNPNSRCVQDASSFQIASASIPWLAAGKRSSHGHFRSNYGQ